MNAEIQITEKCNLRCSYCFEGEKSNITIEESKGREAVDFTFSQLIKEIEGSYMRYSNKLKIDKCELIAKGFTDAELEHLETTGLLSCHGKIYTIESEATKKIDISTFDRIDLLQKLFGISFEVLFYGGEAFLELPLLKSLYSYSESIAKKRNISTSYLIITNAFQISDDVFAFIENNSKKLKIKVSIDGIAEAHDLHRRTVLGSPTYDKVIQNALRLLSLQNDLKVATVITPDSIPYLYESIVKLNGLGFKYFEIGFETLASKWESQQLNILEEQLFKLGKWYIEQKHTGRDITIDEIDKKLDIISNKSNLIPACGRGEFQFFININGEIYPCPIGNKIGPLIFGDIYKGFYNNESTCYFKDRSIDTCDTTCKECIYGRYCFLKCYACNFITTGDIKIIGDESCQVNQAVVNTCIKIGNYMYEKYPDEFKARYHFKQTRVV